ncbi:hypothetical protein [Polaribacter glomeratus]|uniref:Adhesin domain-containing protein n=1 Tax=Polaribacter glomeratus TaxID=102 RepID=A0A2S7WXE4_9FLAO|nr:hypothetical protein [Polaribacter glomeratus]PQJ82274.1 hypothetical protein BTO16_06660 [Polaribacter glomeratus]TXD66869.1 hypothetical protein ESX12_04970 [Polaribacter glomeratus]
MKYIYKITLLFLLFPLITSAIVDGKKQEKKKIIKKEYAVNADAKVSINNKYGNLNITTWDKNRVEIEVTITVKGDDLESVEDKLASIDIQFDASSNFVSAKTNFEKEEKSWSFWKKSSNITYQINYVIKMPKSNSVNLDNDYGSIYLDYLSGNASINCDYGKVSVGELTGDYTTINLDYCNSSTIGAIKTGNINVDYSKISIDKAGDLKVNADYSTLKLGTVGNINFKADYGSISIEEADDVNGNSDYVSMSFGTIRRNLIIDTDYGSISVKKVTKGFEQVTIDAEYADIKIGVESDAVFDFEVDLQYASFKGENDKMEFYQKTSKATKSYYRGKFGKGNSNSKLKIRSQYGGVSITEY